jgi:hypothetical protein
LTQNDWTRDIKRVARKASFDWPGVTDEDDLAQEIHLHILERPGTQEDLAEMDSNARYRTLHKIAQRIASRERVDYEHYSGNFRYAVNEVRAALAAGAMRETERGLSSSWSTEDYVDSVNLDKDPVLGRVALEQDLRIGLKAVAAVNSRYYEVLRKRYLLGEDLFTGDRTVLSRALSLLATKMNHAHKRQHEARPDGPGTRGTVSRSKARWLLKEGYDSDYVPARGEQRNNQREKEIWE